MIISQLVGGISLLILSIDSQKKQIFLDPSPARENEILEFYQRVETNDLDAFTIREEDAPWFYAFLEQLKVNPPRNLKWIGHQTVGPVLLGDIVKQTNRMSAFFDETMKDILTKFVNMKSKWMEQKIKKELPGVDVITGQAETTLVNFTSASGSGTREIIITAIENGFDGLGGPTWIHCCANIDWSLLTEAPVDVINFDAYQHSEKVVLYYKEFKEFLERGGMLAWGIVPVTDESIGQVTVQGLVDIIQKGIDAFAAKGIDELELSAASWIMPCCDTNLMSPDNAELVFTMTREISEVMRKRYGFAA